MWAPATKTRKTYATATRFYTGYCALRLRRIETYLTRVRSTHADMGFEDLSMIQGPVPERMILGVHCLGGEAGTGGSRPTIEDLQQQVLPHYHRRTEAGATRYAAFCSVFVEVLHVGEFYMIKSSG